ncbi:MAG: AMP-dependent synthetase [Desulfobacteraceae bacterium]|nr:MAG: AMP-dependent synthetase [Desulfobacteraceae bacterium]
MSVHSFTIYDLYKRNAQLYKDKTAILSGETRVSFGDLWDQVNALAGELSSRGVCKGDRVALLTKNSPAFMTILGAVAALGAILVPINFRLTAREVSYILEDAEPVTLLYDREYEELLADLVSDISSITELIPFDSQQVSPFPMADRQTFSKEVAASDPLVIIHTAAIQGKPRGAVISHGNLLAGMSQTVSVIGLDSGEIYLNILPLFHIFGLIMALSLMQVAGENIIISRFDPKEVNEIIQQKKVSIVANFPPILSQILDEQEKGGFDLSSLKNVVGLEHPDTISRYIGLGFGQFWLCYGQTETMALTCLSLHQERPGSAGRPVPWVDMAIVDEFDRPVDLGKPGEIVMRGPLVFSGYWKEEELTQMTFRGGWHHTGDLGRLDTDGFLWFMGRKAQKELIKSGGENIYPVEVEKAIMEHPAIEETSVIGVPDSKFGEGIKAICVLRPGAIVTERELVAFVASKIASYKKPRIVRFVDSLPKKADSSINREEVKILYGQNLI